MATGYYGPSEYLSGWTNLNETPEFYWDMEVRRLAADFHPKEKPALVPRIGNDADDGKVDTAPMMKATEDADAVDFAAALKGGEIKPPDPATALKAHTDARAFLQKADQTTAGPPPAEFDSEFADYDRGAFAFRQGEAHWEEARKAWLALLDRPPAERHYRTVWAAFMLGKIAMKSGAPEAEKWFEKTRDLAAAGFGDSLGMAADSYGWEGRSEWKQGRPEKAAPLFLTQLALGDESAVVSLKALIPDRVEVEGMLNYDGNLPDNEDNSTPPPIDPALMTKLAAMAADPLLRRLETAHILATESGAGEWYRYETGPVSTRSARWMGVVKAAGLGRVEDAEYLGWVAYTTGNYKEAQRWLDLSSGESPAANWLRARLELRAGKTAAAAASMATAWEGIRNPGGNYSGQKAPDWDNSIFLYSRDDADLTMEQWAGGDMGAVRLLRSDFVQALDTFLKGDLRDDAAFVAERVLTASELKAYVDRMPAPTPATPAKQEDADTEVDTWKEDVTLWLRYLLGRRLVREDRYAEAQAYLPPAYGKLLGKYAEALKTGADGSLPKATRAEAWSTAAWLARHDGMELMGTEVAPDGFDSGGEFEDIDLAQYRISGTYPQTEGNDNPQVLSLPIPYRPARSEVERLKKNRIEPDIRFHYRVIAAALAMRAAALMSDNTEELADAVNTAGLWVMDRDDKLADRYYGIMEKRCAGTKIGKDVLAKHWFVDETGPWSDALKAQSDALHKDFGIQDPE
jgi:hypothetical protein